MKKLPKSINPTPIVSASIEIRFDVNCPYDLVYGKLFDILVDRYPKVDKLPILNIPENIRIQDNLLETPHYRFYDDNAPYSILLAPKLFTFVYSKQDLETHSDDYQGWSEYIFDELCKLYKSIFDLGIIKKVYKLGIRYNDFFKDINIFDNTTINIVNKNNQREDKISTQITQTKNIEDVINNVTISNNALFQNKTSSYQGSMIDIDSFMINFNTDFISDYKNYLQKVHEINKQLFYDKLTNDFIKSLNPQYGE